MQQQRNRYVLHCVSTSEGCTIATFGRFRALLAKGRINLFFEDRQTNRTLIALVRNSDGREPTQLCRIISATKFASIIQLTGAVISWFHSVKTPVENRIVHSGADQSHSPARNTFGRLPRVGTSVPIVRVSLESAVERIPTLKCRLNAPLA